MENPVGYRFSPTDKEIVESYLWPKIQDSNTSDVDRVVSTVDIYSFDPCELPSQSMIQSGDQVWYFFVRKDNRGDRQSRKTKSGFWKKTGKTMEILKRNRRNREKIGEKRVFVFHKSGSKTKWVMHEYQATSLSQMMMTYTICKLKFNGEERDISTSFSGNHSLITHTNNSGGVSTGSEGSLFECLQSQELENPRQFSGFLDVHEELQLEHAMHRALDNLSADDWKSLLLGDDNELEQSNIVSMQEDCNKYRPRKPVTGVFSGHTTDDSDSDSITRCSSIQTSSTCGSFGCSNHRIDQITDLQESPNLTIKFVSLTQKVSQSLGQDTDIGEQKLGQETIKTKRAGFFYRIIQKFVKKIQICSSIPRT